MPSAISGSSAPLAAASWKATRAWAGRPSFLSSRPVAWAVRPASDGFSSDARWKWLRARLASSRCAERSAAATRCVAAALGSVARRGREELAATHDLAASAAALLGAIERTEDA